MCYLVMDYLSPCFFFCFLLLIHNTNVISLRQCEIRMSCCLKTLALSKDTDSMSYLFTNGIVVLKLSCVCGHENLLLLLGLCYRCSWYQCSISSSDYSVLTRFLRYTSSQDEEGAAGGETAKPSQQTRAWGQEHLPGTQRPGTTGNQTTDWDEARKVRHLSPGL